LAKSGNGPTAKEFVLVNNRNITDAGFTYLRAFTALTLINVSGCENIADSSAVVMRHNMPSLTSLDISGTSITDKGIVDIMTGCRRIAHLFIRDSQFLTDKGIQSIHANLKLYKEFRTFDFSGSRCFSNEGLIQLIAEGGGILHDINLERCKQITDLGLMGFRRFGKVSMACKKLNVSTLKIHDSSMTWLAEGCQKLEYLDLTDTISITDSCLSYLSKGCCRLRTLILKGCHHITNAGLQQFIPEGGKSLTNLDLTDCSKIGDQGCFVLALHSQSLKDLNLFGVPHVSNNGLSRIAQCCRALNSLNFSADINSLDTSTKARVPHVGGEGIKSLGKYSKYLTSIKCCGAARVNDLGICDLTSGCNALTEIHLRYCYQLTDIALTAIANNCPLLQSLDVGSCVMISDVSVEVLATRCPDLSHIDFLGLRKVTDKSFAKFVANHPKLSSVSIQSCEYISDDSIVMLAQASNKTLTHLDVSSVDDLTDKTLFALQTYTPNLQSADFHFCSISDEALKQLIASLPFGRKVGGKRAIKPINKMVQAKNQHSLYVKRVANAQIKLAVNIRVFLQKRFFQKQKAFKILNITHIQKGIRGYYGRQRVKRIISRNLLELNSAVFIQRFYRSYREQLFAVALVQNKRLKFLSAKAIQNCVRAFIARNIVMREKMKMRRVGARLRKLVRKRLQKEAQLMEYLASCKIQKFWRVILPKIIAWRENSAAEKIQNAWRCMLSRMKYEDKLATKMGLLGKCARVIQRVWHLQLWWRAKKVEAEQYFRDCQAYHMERVECASTIQREFRSYKQKGVARQVIILRRLQRKSAIKIQNMFRNWVAKGAVERIRKYKMYLIMSWKMLVDKVVLRHKGKYAYKIQKMVRYKLWWERRKRSVNLLQRAYRGYQGRCIYHQLLFEIHTNAVLKIQYCFRIFAGRLFREDLWELKHESCSIIQRKFRRWKEWKAYKKMMSDIYAKKAHEAQLEKEALERQRQEALLQRIFEKGDARAARCVQRRFRTYLQAKKLAEQERIEIERKLRDEKEEAERTKRMQERKKYKNSFMGKLNGGFEYIGSHVNWLTSKYDPNSKNLDERDAAMRARNAMKTNRSGLKRVVLGPDKQERLQAAEVYDNSILNRQTRSIVSEGILGMKITIGNGEFFAMEQEQKNNKLTKLPVWTPIKMDLSGRKKDGVFIWTLRGVGKEVFTSLSYSIPPPNYDNWQVQKSRHAAMQMMGTSIVWHKFLAKLEIHAYAAVMDGKSAPPIDYIKVSTDESQHAQLKRDDYIMVENDLSMHELGRGVHIWYHTKNFIKEPKLHKVTTELLGQYNWYDSRMDQVMESYGLKPDNVLELHKIFSKLDYKGNNIADVVEFFDVLGEPRSTYGDWLLKSVDTDSKSQISFSEYVHIVTSLCMFGKNELLRFIFGMFDDERRSYLDRDQWESLILIMMKHEEVPHSKKAFNAGFDTYATTIGKKGSGEPEMFFEDFIKILKSYPIIAYPMFRLQEKIMDRNLGRDFWTKQKEDFVEARKVLKVKRK